MGGQCGGELVGVGVTHLRAPALSLWPLGGHLRHFHGVYVHRSCVSASCRGGRERWATDNVCGWVSWVVVHVRAVWGYPGVQGSEHAAMSAAGGCTHLGPPPPSCRCSRAQFYCVRGGFGLFWSRSGGLAIDVARGKGGGGY